MIGVAMNVWSMSRLNGRMPENSEKNPITMRARITAILVGTMVFGEALTSNIITGILISVVVVTFMIMVTKR